VLGGAERRRILEFTDRRLCLTCRVMLVTMPIDPAIEGKGDDCFEEERLGREPHLQRCVGRTDSRV
jgi:hypothetical protein